MNYNTPNCPHCGYSMTFEDMQDETDVDLFALAPKEDRAPVKCPSCDLEYWVQGGYVPQYSSAFCEDELS